MQDVLQKQPYHKLQRDVQCTAHNAARNELRRNEMHMDALSDAFYARIPAGFRQAVFENCKNAWPKP